MAIIKAILKKDKKLPGKKSRELVKSVEQMYPIYIRLHHQHRRKYLSTGRYVLEKDWDEKNGLVRKTNNNYVALNAIIRKDIKKMEQEVLLVLATEENTDVISMMQKKEKKQTMNNIFLIAEKYFRELEETKKFARLSSERPRVKHLKEFNRSGLLRFEDITPPMLREFQIYLKKEHKCGDRTVMNHLVVIRTLYNYAMQEGIADRNLYPFGKGKVLIKFPEGLKVGLNEHEVRLLEEADFSSELHLEFAKNVWLFSFYLAGIRISDVFRLRWKDCIDGRLTYVMGKNSKIVSLKLPEKAIIILNKYRPTQPDYENFVFRILTLEDDLDSRETYVKLRSANHKVDDALKKMGKRLGITKKFSCHISRHTFGNITGDKISPQMLQKLYRHTDIKTTMGYQANFIHRDVDDALESVLNF